ncbi:uncharacterized protein LY79DRAFT_157618 [Colletotrichum navitas]|uniref:Uncharacterized protein n=1 Tax=Colletotrichum navitas TaxID=681940 RepID=A0AAD8Q2V0_9PEZI|nr:uncharacterized protein LY79DRAFT_157618 [Colletotrichum navitas]KAK1594460.1 hypothetical protein LY79DRAFT_157618 [Colletotrichum navitas]
MGVGIMFSVIIICYSASCIGWSLNGSCVLAGGTETRFFPFLFSSLPWNFGIVSRLFLSLPHLASA